MRTDLELYKESPNRESADQHVSLLLQAADIKRLEAIREGFELPLESSGLIAQIYTELVFSPKTVPHEQCAVFSGALLPISSVELVAPGQTFRFKTEVTSPFLPRRLVLGKAWSAHEWQIDNISIDGCTVIKNIAKEGCPVIRNSPLHGDFFTPQSWGHSRTDPEWRECRKFIEWEVTNMSGHYRPSKPEPRVFTAVLLGESRT